MIGKNKYKVAPKELRTFEGIVFHSKREMTRYKDLRLLQLGKQITELTLQVPFEFKAQYWVNGSSQMVTKKIKYISDFMYLEDGKRIVEDVKGFETKEFKFKKELFLKLYPQYELRITK